MIIFIDESGTHKQSGHSSIALVYIEVTSVDKFEKAVEQIEKDLEITYFHWTDERWDTRIAFIQRLLELDFICKVAVIENPIRVEKKLEEVLQHLVIEKHISKIVIDGKKPRWYSLRLKKVLRDKNISVKKITTVRRDETSSGLRVADCLAGLTRYAFDQPKSTAEKWYKQLKKKGKIQFELISP